MKRLLVGGLLALTFVTGAWSGETTLRGAVKSDIAEASPPCRPTAKTPAGDACSTAGNSSRYAGGQGKAADARPTPARRPAGHPPPRPSATPGKGPGGAS